jgi:polar amino acid transport system substrate-binding protein
MKIGTTLITAALITFGMGQANAESISIRADEWCPYNCAPDSDAPGFMIEIAKEVFEPMGHTIEYKTLNWSRAIVETRKSKYVAIVGASMGDAEDFVFPASALGQSSNSLYVVQSDDWTYTGLDSVKGRKVGIIQD